MTIGTEERFIWSSKKVYFQGFFFCFFFMTCKCISDLHNTINLNMFHNRSGVYSFVRKFHKIYGDESSMGPKEIEVVSFRVILKQ